MTPSRIPDPDQHRQLALRAAERAIAELRRGAPVLVCGPDEACLMLAAEMVDDTSLERLAELAGEDGAGKDAAEGGGAERGKPAPTLAITAHRGAALHIPPTGDDALRLTITGDMDAATLRELADATFDLDQPLRGPFERLKEPLPESAAAAIALCKRGRLLPAAITLPVGPDDVEILTLERGLLAVTVGQIAGYEDNAAFSLRRVGAARVPLEGAENTRIIAFRPQDGGIEHLAILIGDPNRHDPVLARLHSECFTGDLLGSLKCDCGQQLKGAIEAISAEGGGVLLYLAQEGRGIGLINKLRAYRLQDQGFDTVEANERLGFDADERVFRPAAEMLKLMGFSAVRLMTNNPDKVASLGRFGIRVAERVAHAFPSNTHNEFYLATKKAKSGHYL